MLARRQGGLNWPGNRIIWKGPTWIFFRGFTPPNVRSVSTRSASFSLWEFKARCLRADPHHTHITSFGALHYLPRGLAYNASRFLELKGPNQQRVIYFHQGSLEQVFELGGAGETQGGNRTFKIRNRENNLWYKICFFCPFWPNHWIPSKPASLNRLSLLPLRLPSTNTSTWFPSHDLCICAVPSAWNALPIAAGKGCSSVLPQDSAEALSFQGVFSMAHSWLSSKS